MQLPQMPPCETHYSRRKEIVALKLKRKNMVSTPIPEARVKVIRCSILFVRNLDLEEILYIQYLNDTRGNEPVIKEINNNLRIMMQ